VFVIASVQQNKGDQFVGQSPQAVARDGCP